MTSEEARTIALPIVKRLVAIIKDQVELMESKPPEKKTRLEANAVVP